MTRSRIYSLAVLMLWPTLVMAVPLQDVSTYGNANTTEFRKANSSLLVAKGKTDNLLYVLEVDPVTGQLPVAGTFSATFDFDTNWGPVGVKTLRGASIIGNESGKADFGAGTTSAQTLRVVLPTDQTAIPVTASVLPLPTGAATESTLSTLNTKLNADFGASSGSIRAAAQIGNSSGAATFGAGTTSTQTLRVVLPTDQTAIPAAQSGTWNITNISGTVPLPTGAATETTLGTRATESTLSTLNTKVTNGYGSAAGAVRAAAQVGNTTGEADFGSGASTAQTLRTVLSTRQEAAATPVATRLSNGTSFLDSGPGSASTTTLRVTPATDGNPKYGRSVVTYTRNVYSSTPVTTGGWVQLVASTSADIHEIEIFDSSGQTMVIGTGAVASEIGKFQVFPGGNGRIPVFIPAGTRISIIAISGNASVGENTINYYGL